MAEFFDLALQYPTAIFSVLLVAVLFYWCLVILGSVDIDALDLDFDVDTDVDLDVDVDADVGHKGMSFLDLLVKLNLDEVPVTVSMSMIVLSSWVLSMVTVEWLGPIASSLLVATGIGIGCFALSLGVARQLIIPLKPIFADNPAPEKRGLVGQTCTITTLRVDEKYGQAEVDDGAAGFIIQVRSAVAEQLTRGTEALIYDYDSVNDVFHVKPLH